MKKAIQIFPKPLGLCLFITLSLGLMLCQKKKTNPVAPTFKTRQITKGPDTLVDIDGNVYKTTTIGNQTWMAENLKTTKYKNGKPITLVKDQVTWAGNWDYITTIPMMCYYDNDTSKAATYGALYNGFVMNTDNLCPTGWHIPAVQEWDTLFYRLGNGDPRVIVNIKDFHSLNLLPAGYRKANGAFSDIGTQGDWWSNTDTYPDQGRSHSWGLELDTVSGVESTLGYYSKNKGKGLSVRCIWD